MIEHRRVEEPDSVTDAFILDVRLKLCPGAQRRIDQGPHTSIRVHARGFFEERRSCPDFTRGAEDGIVVPVLAEETASTKTDPSTKTRAPFPNEKVRARRSPRTTTSPGRYSSVHRLRWPAVASGPSTMTTYGPLPVTRGPEPSTPASMRRTVQGGRPVARSKISSSGARRWRRGRSSARVVACPRSSSFLEAMKANQARNGPALPERLKLKTWSAEAPEPRGGP